MRELTEAEYAKLIAERAQKFDTSMRQYLLIHLNTDSETAEKGIVTFEELRNTALELYKDDIIELDMQFVENPIVMARKDPICTINGNTIEYGPLCDLFHTIMNSGGWIARFLTIIQSDENICDLYSIEKSPDGKIIRIQAAENNEDYVCNYTIFWETINIDLLTAKFGIRGGQPVIYDGDFTYHKLSDEKYHTSVVIAINTFVYKENMLPALYIVSKSVWDLDQPILEVD